MTKECVMQCSGGLMSSGMCGVQTQGQVNMDLWSLDIRQIPSLYENYRIHQHTYTFHKAED